MRRMLSDNRTFRAGAAFAALLALTGCTTSKTETPPLTGPSGLGTSLVITASPDTVSQDGASQSLVQITVSDSNGSPKRNVGMRIEIAVDGAITDFGRLSARTVVTDQAGRASVVYTAPPPVLGFQQDVVVQILATPTEGDFGNATRRVANIRVVPTGIIPPPLSPIVPDFVVPTPTIGNPVTFNATFTGGTLDQIVGLLWDFGDGTTGGGLTTTHTYNSQGIFVVTLAILDSLGRSNSVTKAVAVNEGSLPVASFVVSPVNPAVHQTVNFNASGSVAEPGHRVVEYSWNFGDGTLGSGNLATHSYETAGTYTVTLKVTDDMGRKSSLASQTISVGLAGPTASFTTSPGSPIIGQIVNFNASQSRPTPGRTIVSYSWDFGDGTSGTGVNTTHAYAAVGTYTVTLTVTDNAGQTGFATQTITVTTDEPTASFTAAPNPATVNANVFFDASASTARGGRTIVSYAWTFSQGPPPTSTGRTTNHTFTATGAQQVALTVTDSAGRTSTSTQVITVNPPAPLGKR